MQGLCLPSAEVQTALSSVGLGLDGQLLLCTVISQSVLPLSNSFVWYTLATAKGCTQRERELRRIFLATWPQYRLSKRQSVLAFVCSVAYLLLWNSLVG